MQGTGLLSPEVIHFITGHPEKAILMLHHIHKRKSKGKGMKGSGTSFKNLWKSVKNVGEKAVSTAYKGAEKFYDYTNGLPFKAAEHVAKKIFNTDLTEYSTYRDAKRNYGYATGDPRRFKDLYEAVKDPKKTLANMKRYVLPVVAGAVSGGPSGAAAGAVKSRIAGDITADIGKITGKGIISGIPANIIRYIKRSPSKARGILDHVEDIKGKGISKNWKKALKIATGVGAGTGLMLYGFVKENPHLIPQIRNAIQVHLGGSGVRLAGQTSKSVYRKLPSGKTAKWTPIPTREVPKKFQDWIKQNPSATKKIVNKINKEAKKSGSGMVGRGILSKIKTILAGIGLTGLVGAYAFAKWYGKLAEADAHSAENKTAFYIDQVIKQARSDLAKEATRRIVGSGEGIKEYEKKYKKHATIIRDLAKEQAGSGWSKSKIKKILAAVGIPLTAGALAYAKHHFDKSADYDSPGLEDIPADKYYEMFPEDLPGQGKRRKKTIYVPNTQKTIGTKKEVYHGLAKRTAGRLTKSDLIKNSRGKIVSKKQAALGKKNYQHIKKYSFKKKK